MTPCAGRPADTPIAGKDIPVCWCDNEIVIVGLVEDLPLLHRMADRRSSCFQAAVRSRAGSSNENVEVLLDELAIATRR